jgi:hypothetical protein
MNYAWVAKFVRIFLIGVNSVLLAIGVLVLIAIVSIKLSSDLNPTKFEIVSKIAHYGIITHLHIYLYFVSVLLICISSIGLYGVLKENNRLLVIYLALLIGLFLIQIIMLSMYSYGSVFIETYLTEYLNIRIKNLENEKKHCEFLKLFMDKECCQKDEICCKTDDKQDSCSAQIISKTKESLTGYMLNVIILINFILFNEFSVLIMVTFLLGKFFYSDTDIPDSVSLKRDSLFA